MIFKFAIVGGGLSATSMLVQFVARIKAEALHGQLDPSKISLQIYEKQDQFGPGFPHSDRFALPFHITNMCASDMGIVHGNSGDFQDWVGSNAVDLQNRFSWLRTLSAGADNSVDRCKHYPRALMGEYLKTKFQEAVQAAQQLGIVVHLFTRSEVIDLKLGNSKIILVIRDLRSDESFSRQVDRVVLATGHWFEKNEQDHYFSSPWPADTLRRSIPNEAKVAIIGTSLSAIEALLTLSSQENFVRRPGGELVYKVPEKTRSFCLYSRRGLLPKVRGKLGTYRNRFLTRENLARLLSENPGKLTLDAIFTLLDKELEAAYCKKIKWAEIVNPVGSPANLLQGYIDDAINGDGPEGDILWQTVLYQRFDMAREVYLNLTLAERKRFDEKYTSLFFTHAATQPAVNAEKLLALIKAGVVQVFKLGKNYRCIRKDSSDSYEIIFRDVFGNVQKDIYRYVVNARGQAKSLLNNPSLLIKNLLQNGIITIEESRPVAGAFHSSDEIIPGKGCAYETYKTGSILIDPESHRIITRGADSKVTKSDAIYAVGAMTRGQIINASMASGIVEATSRITDDLVAYLIETLRS